MNQTHILVVDDEPHIADSLADFLRHKAGYTVTTAGDGAEAMRILAGGTPAGPVDLVVLDSRMPEVSGTEVLAWLRQHPTLAFTRVIMLTATTGSQAKIDALSAGADDYVLKPYYPQEMLARINTILRTQQLEKQLQRQSQQLAALNQASNAVTTTLDMSQIPAAAVRGTCAVLDVPVAAIFLQSDKNCLVCSAAEAIPRPGHPPISVTEQFPSCEPGRGAIGRVFASNSPLVINDLAAGPAPGSPAGLPLHNLIALPLVVRHKPMGVLAGYNKPTGPFSDVDADLFASFASAVSQALENASLFRRVRLRQQELQESHNRLQAVMDAILTPIYTLNDDWQLVAVNRYKADALGTTSDALVGRHCYRALFGRETPCDHCRVAHTLADSQPRRWSVNWVGSDHLPQEWDIHAYPIPGTQAGSARTVVVWQDRTEERRLEHSLLQAGKLAAIGQLAAGVAHEINNPLTAINANAEMLKMFIPPDDENYESVELIAQAGERATNVVRHLLDFARQNQYAFAPGDVNQSITQALKLTAYQMTAAAVQIHTDLDETLPPVLASWEHLKTVWLNLLLNARDAVLSRPGGSAAGPGRIDINTRPDPAGEHLLVLFRDNGIGMTPAQQNHIFEPFYTTKAPGQGTGLGLATSHRIIEQHGGQVEVFSSPDEGTTFIIRLPISAAAAQNEQVQHEPSLA